MLAVTMMFTACGNQTTETKNDTSTEIVQTDSETENDTEIVEENENQGVIYTSIYPIYNLTKQIAGDKYEVRNFSSLKTESHGWEPSAKDMADLSEASLIFINGAGMEEWEESVKDAIDIDMVDTSANANLLEATGDHTHDYDHQDEDHDHDYEDEDNDYDHEDHDHVHGQYDPHTWLSPIVAKDQAKVIADKLSDIDPANKEYYMANYDKVIAELNDIIKEYEEKFEETTHKNFLVNHKAFSYLARDFGLNQLALTDLTSTGDEGARDVKQMIDTANELGINTVFYEKGTDGKSAQTIADEIGAETATLNTMEFATDEDLDNNITYQQLIRENLEAIYQSMIN